MDKYVTYNVHACAQCKDLVKGGAPASAAESCRRSEAESRERSEQYAAGVQGPLKGPGSFWVFNAQICILTHSREFLSILTPKVDKNRALNCQSSMKKCFKILRLPSEARLKNFMTWVVKNRSILTGNTLFQSNTSSFKVEIYNR